MIRRDYLLRMIEQFFQALTRLKSLKEGEQWNDANALLDEEFNRLVGAGPEAVARLSETELLAKLIKGEPTQVVRHKTLLLSTLLKEAGDVEARRGRADESRLCYLKGLHLLLDVLASHEVIEAPDFVPKVEVFVAALQDLPLPLQTEGMLMQHYERSGQFGRAEDAFYAMLEADPDNPAIVDFGIAFYQRLRGQSDLALEEGNLSRPEVELETVELTKRKAGLISKPGPFSK